MLRVVFEWTIGLQDSGKDTVFIRSNGCFCAFSIPIQGKLSFPKMFRSCPVVMKIGFSNEIHPLDCILTTIFSIIFNILLLKLQIIGRSFFNG